jgi:peptidyl-prolyl cis-trans isomerase-like protein 2
LDGKHSIFGQLVGGESTLAAMENVELDDKERPLPKGSVKIKEIAIFKDPYEEYEKAEKEKGANEARAKAEEAETKRLAMLAKERERAAAVRADIPVGKYLQQNQSKKRSGDQSLVDPNKKRK